MDSNHGRRSQRVYSPSPLATRAHPQFCTVRTSMCTFQVARLRGHSLRCEHKLWNLTVLNAQCQRITRHRAYLFCLFCRKCSRYALSVVYDMPLLSSMMCPFCHPEPQAKDLTKMLLPGKILRAWALRMTKLEFPMNSIPCLAFPAVFGIIYALSMCLDSQAIAGSVLDSRAICGTSFLLREFHFFMAVG